MNRIVCTLVLLLVVGSLTAKPRNRKQPAATATAIATTQAQLSQQVNLHVTYPTVMAEGNYAGVVVITFSLSEDSRVAQLTVHTANKNLNDELTGQLAGKKIRLHGTNPNDVHTVRLRFVK